MPINTTTIADTLPFKQIYTSVVAPSLVYLAGIKFSEFGRISVAYLELVNSSPNYTQP